MAASSRASRGRPGRRAAVCGAGEPDAGRFLVPRPGLAAARGIWHQRQLHYDLISKYITLVGVHSNPTHELEETLAATSIPRGAVIRVSRGNFDRVRFAEVEQMTRDTGAYLIPAIRQLDGLISYHAGASDEGSMVHVSVWQSNDHAEQMSTLKEMVVDARRDADAVGVSFIPIVNYPIAWHIEGITGTGAAAR